MEIFAALNAVHPEKLSHALQANQAALGIPELDPSALEMYRQALLAALAANGGRPV